MNCGRHETRAIKTIPISAESCGFPFAAQTGRISTSIEHRSGKVTEHRYILITSAEQMRMSALKMLRGRRNYWGIESGLHARLDVSGLEDKSRVRLRNNAVVLALLRRAAVSIACAWMSREPNTRRANLPGFFEAMRSNAVELATQSPAKNAASLRALVE